MYGLDGQTSRKLLHSLFFCSLDVNRLETVGLQDSPDRDNGDTTLSIFIMHINYSGAQVVNSRLGLAAEMTI